MCRIAGIISARMPATKLLHVTKVMCDTLAHGGPDDEGIYHAAEHGLAFGHRRLAIIDLSANGHQPMGDAGDRVWITFNGEIYNYLQLKDELLQQGAVFATDTDTEVIIQAYITWGTAAFDRLRGMFAFALYDKQQALTYLVRDSMGIKPLYYHISNGQLTFASEVKAFKACGIVTEADPDWPIRFLAFGHIPEPFTTLKNVLSLPKGNFLRWKHQSNTHELSPYQLPDRSAPVIHTETDAQNAIHDTLNATIERQLLADAPIGVFLSGGIDSSLVTLLAHRTKKNELRTVSIFFDEQAYNERSYQDVIVQQTGAINYSHLVKQAHLEEALPDIMKGMDMPTTDGINSWFISKYAREDGLKAVLSGLGADELFGGYPSFKRIKYLKYIKLIPAFILKMIGRISVGSYKRVALLAYTHPIAEYLFLRGLFVPSDISKILGLPESYVLNVLFAAPIYVDHLTEQQKASWFEMNLYMQNQLLRDTDVMSMAHGLEVRVPFLDEDLVRTVDQIAPAIRFDLQKPKKVLIDSYPGVLPKQVWDRPKMGFSFPLQQWLRAHTEINDAGLYQNQQSRKVIRRFNRNEVHWSRAFALYQLRLHQLDHAQPSPKKVMLLTLETFSATGGIQKMTRAMAQAIQQIALKKNWRFNLWSGYDHDSTVNRSYVRPANFKGFNKNRWLFALNSVRAGMRTDMMILSHINLAAIGWLVKMLNPDCKIWLVAHGIEVWRPLTLFKKSLVSKCDKIICVSDFTRKKMMELHQADINKCVVLNNALDPLIKLPERFEKPAYLLQRYGLATENKVIFTLTRLASTEQYKGYEQVIKVVGRLKDKFPEIRYVLSGKYDKAEDERIRALIAHHQVQDKVIVTGFINESELEDHFLLADIFVLPSKKEGFGIVFIEALACGLPVICGNEDGSLDAIRHGELGTAINVDDLDELEREITRQLNTRLTADDRLQLQSRCLDHFNATDYMNKLEQMLTY